MLAVNETHDPELRSWVESANQPGADFPIQNLPFGVFRRALTPEPPRVGVAIGDRILDLRLCHRAGLFDGDLAPVGERVPVAVAEPPDGAWARPAGRRCAAGSASCCATTGRRALQKKVEPCLVPMAEAVMLLPSEIGDYTDFYASIFHATNVGTHVPARQSAAAQLQVRADRLSRPRFVASWSAARRCGGRTGRPKPESAMEPIVRPVAAARLRAGGGLLRRAGQCARHAIPIAEAEEHLFGVCLVNDWSARDIQAWEYQPLGPFLAKSFATTISPWVVTLEALEPFRVPALMPARRRSGAAAVSRRRASARPRRARPPARGRACRASSMRDAKIAPFVVSRNSLRHLYWTPGQLLTHHASNGCNLRPGDLLASGTVSGPTRESRGCLLELTWRGEQPITLPTGETRAFLEDGDEVIFRGCCEREGWCASASASAGAVILPA